MKNQKHLFHYLLLLFIVTICIITIVILGKDSNLNYLVIVTMSFLYVLWGILHHLSEKTLTSEVLMEYLVYSLLGSALVLGVLRYL